MATVEGLNVVKRHTKQGYGGSKDGRHLREGSADSARRPAVRLPEVRDSRRGSVAAPARTGKQRVVCALRRAGRPTGRRGADDGCNDARLREHYRTDVRKALIERFGYKNVHQVPKLEKVVINMSVSDAISDAEGARRRRPRSSQTISRSESRDHQGEEVDRGFQAARRHVIGAKVTLRGERMYVFLDKLFNIVLPRIRDFRGLPRKSFDGRGNYNLGLREQIVFPGDQLRQGRQGARDGHRDRDDRRNDEEATEFLTQMGLPLQKDRSDGFRAGQGIAMAKTSLIEKSKRTPKFGVRAAQPVPACGRPRGYYRKFGLCRICFRENAHRGFIPGITKACGRSDYGQSSPTRSPTCSRAFATRIRRTTRPSTFRPRG